MHKLEVFPRHQWMHQKKGLPIYEVQLVHDGRVIKWVTPDSVALSLTAIDDRRNWKVATTRQRHSYRKALDTAVERLDVQGMKNVIRSHARLIPQADEILALPDSLLQETAALMASAMNMGL